MQTKSYKSTFNASPVGEVILRKGHIIDDHETSADMTNRMLNELFDIELSAFNTSPKLVASLKKEFGLFLDKKDCVMSTPIMTNAGRYSDKPLSAVTVPPISLLDSRNKIKQIIDSYHQDAIGTGFNLDETDDPAETLRFINKVAVDGANSGKEDRPVGNMAVLSVHHPKILDFIASKIGAHTRGDVWKFNISVDASAEYMEAVKLNKEYKLWNGQSLNARKVLKKIVEAAHDSADPGLVFLHRMNKDNPTPSTGNYVSTAPCADVGLAPGESCQFGYINLGNFVQNDGKIDLKKLKKLVHLMTRALDNSLEISLQKYKHEKNISVMRAKRKIGIGICGVADMLVKLKVPYDTEKGRNIIRDITAYINYESKIASHKLAYKRGSFGAMNLKGNKYLEKSGFIENKYGKIETSLISKMMWIELGKKLRKTKMLRNASTIALPPTGRSGLVIDASTGIEPHFSLIDYGGDIYPSLLEDLKILYNRKRITEEQFSKALETIKKTGQISQIDYLPSELKSIYKTALDIDSADHLLMIAAIQPVIDEAVSKTVNMSANASTEDIMNTYIQSYELGLKGITIYREGIAKNQPRKLSKK